MNPFLIPVIFGTFAFFLLGIRLANRTKSVSQTSLLFTVSILAAVPAILFIVFYSGIFGEAIWFYRFRAMPGAELFACGIGLLAGYFQGVRNRTPQLSKYVSRVFIPFIMVICVVIPYLKPIFLRPDWNNFSDQWAGNVCLQSSESSCGPASAATLLKFFGKPASEKQIAQESFTSRRGTENWYLLRTLRRHGLNANYEVKAARTIDFSFPSIIGVRLGDESGSGHYITVLGKKGDKYLIGDPLNGLNEFDETRILNHYYLTGFSIIVSTNPP